MSNPSTQIVVNMLQRQQHELLAALQNISERLSRLEEGRGGSGTCACDAGGEGAGDAALGRYGLAPAAEYVIYVLLALRLAALLSSPLAAFTILRRGRGAGAADAALAAGLAFVLSPLATAWRLLWQRPAAAPPAVAVELEGKVPEEEEKKLVEELYELLSEEEKEAIGERLGQPYVRRLTLGQQRQLADDLVRAAASRTPSPIPVPSGELLLCAGAQAAGHLACAATAAAGGALVVQEVLERAAGSLNDIRGGLVGQVAGAIVDLGRGEAQPPSSGPPLYQQAEEPPRRRWLF